MNAAEFGEYWRLQGYRVIETESSYWHRRESLVYISFPYHRVVNPAREELSRLLFRAPAAAVRYQSLPDAIHPHGGLFVCSSRDYDLSLLHKKARNQTRRGLENCTIEQVEMSYLARYGHGLTMQTLQRQGRRPQRGSLRKWLRSCDVASSLPGFEAWGARVGGRLAAFMLTALVEGYLSILDQSSATEYLHYYPNNALTFAVTKLKLSDPKVTCVSYGLKSLEDTEGLNLYKIRMGFQLEPRSDCVVFNPVVKPLLSGLGRKLIVWIARQRPDNDLLRKVSYAIKEDKGVRSNSTEWEGSDAGKPAISKRGVQCRPMTPGDLDRVVAIHRVEFEGFFLSFLGPRFLRLFYWNTIESESSITIVAEDEAGEVVGFVAGHMNPARFYRRLLLRRWWAFGFALLPSFWKRPSILFRTFHAVAERVTFPNNPREALLASIAVSRQCRGAGWGRQLVESFLQWCRYQSASSAWLTTDRDDNEGVNRFYRALGWELEAQLKTPEGRWLSRYIYKLGDIDTPAHEVKPAESRTTMP
jgi:GNAT superfamily N-acetyltransferase